MCVNERASGVYTHILSPSACLAAPFLLCSSHTTSELDGITLPQILAHTNTHKNTRAQTGRSSPSQPRHVLSEHIRRRAERNTLSHMNGATGRAAVKLLRSHTHTHTHTISLARVSLSVPARPETIPRHKKSSSPSFLSLFVPR